MTPNQSPPRAKIEKPHWDPPNSESSGLVKVDFSEAERKELPFDENVWKHSGQVFTAWSIMKAIIQPRNRRCHSRLTAYFSSSKLLLSDLVTSPVLLHFEAAAAECEVSSFRSHAKCRLSALHSVFASSLSLS